MRVLLRSLFTSALALPLAVLAQSDAQITLEASLPQTGTVVVLSPDTPPIPIIVHASEVQSNSHAVGNLARGMVYAGPKSGLALTGQHAALSLRTTTPTLYVRLSEDDPELMRDRVALIMLRVNNDAREVAQFSANVFGGQHKRTMDEIAVTRTDLPNSPWLRLVPTQPLAPGEYGIVFMPADKRSFTSTVYDFGIAATR